jgi:Tfp pilus assembly protein PilF
MSAKTGMVTVILKLLPVLALLGMGCGLPQQRLNQDFVKTVRPASGEVARLRYNAHYFKVMGQPQLALKEMEESYRRDPGNLEIADLLAGYYDELGMYQDAEKIYQQSLSRYPDQQVLRNNLCFSYYLAGNFSQAEECFRHCLSRDPQNQAARNNLGLLLCHLGHREEARRLWEEAGNQEEAAKKLELAMAALGKDGSGARPEQVAKPAPVLPQSAAQAQSRPDAEGSVAAAPVKKVASEKSPEPPAAVVRQQSVAAPPAAPRHAALAKTVRDANPGQGQGAPPSPARTKQAANLAQSPPPVLVKARKEENAAPSAGPVAAPAGTPEKSKEDLQAKSAGAQGLRQAHISAQELLETSIEVQNGNGIHDQARAARSLMNLEGLDDISIGNYVDFGVERTEIRYRPEAERVARMLHDKLFAKAELKIDPKLAEDVDIKVILGHDAPELPQIMAQQPGEAKKSL